MVAPDRLVILHAPSYGPRFDLNTIRTAEETDADSIGYSEAYKVAAALPARPKYSALVGHSFVDTRLVKSPMGDAGDNPIAVSRRHEHHRGRVFKANDPGHPIKYAPERYVYAVDYRWAGVKVCHISAHPSPLVVGIVPWRAVMRVVAREVQAAKDRGCYVVVTGDLNARLMATRALKSCGLKVWRDRIDFIGYDPRLLLVSRRTFRPAGVDHNWMLGTFIVNGGGR